MTCELFIDSFQSTEKFSFKSNATFFFEGKLVHWTNVFKSKKKKIWENKKKLIELFTTPRSVSTR